MAMTRKKRRKYAKTWTHLKKNKRRNILTKMRAKILFGKVGLKNLLEKLILRMFVLLVLQDFVVAKRHTVAHPATKETWRHTFV